jgi:hypothetical protein
MPDGMEKKKWQRVTRACGPMTTKTKKKETKKEIEHET